MAAIRASVPVLDETEIIIIQDDREMSTEILGLVMMLFSGDSSLHVDYSSSTRPQHSEALFA